MNLTFNNKIQIKNVVTILMSFTTIYQKKERKMFNYYNILALL